VKLQTIDLDVATLRVNDPRVAVTAGRRDAATST
jgi:hypothetical protein